MLELMKKRKRESEAIFNTYDPDIVSFANHVIERRGGLIFETPQTPSGVPSNRQQEIEARREPR
jgi:hypothetical protein